MRRRIFSKKNSSDQVQNSGTNELLFERLTCLLGSPDDLRTKNPLAPTFSELAYF